MGDKFSDNSRYLYQYLFANKKQLGLEKVIWITRNDDVNKLLNSLGYESYLVGTSESKYWHLKSGVHILCNMAFPQINFETDIDTKYSWGAIKFQLWHGVGMKSVGAASNKERNSEKSVINRVFHSSRIAVWCSLGGWKDEFFLSTSQRNAEVNYAISLCRKNHLFISAYPRNCDCIKLLPEENKIIRQIKHFKKVVGYFPTFRSDYTEYIHPLRDKSFVEYLQANKILWVEKKHSADISDQMTTSIANILLLDKNFDLNVLYRYFSVVISDYSSVVFDCVYKNIPVVMFCPDLEKFKDGDVGFLFDIESYCDGMVAKKMDELFTLLDAGLKGIYFDVRMQETYSKIRREFFDNRESNYLDIWNDMKKIINKI